MTSMRKRTQITSMRKRTQITIMRKRTEITSMRKRAQSENYEAFTDTDYKCRNTVNMGTNYMYRI